jgi:t-SNARE complex subunit (syntaxin)
MDIQSMKVQKQFAKPEATEKQLRSVCAERSCFRFAEALFSFCG